MILKVLLNTQMMWTIFVKTLKSTTQIRNKYYELIIVLVIVFDDKIPDMLSNKKLNPIVTELFIRARKLKTSLVFFRQSYFALQKILD